jgi:hypothetical protein
MTDKQLNVVIAESCGYKLTNFWVWDQDGQYKVEKLSKDGSWEATEIPDYVNDLNLMHEVEKTLSDVPITDKEKSEKTKYREYLCVATAGEGGPITASSRKRALSFIKTKGFDIEL